MVQTQLITLEHLRNSEYGRPFPRHGLQLLFWFANECVTCKTRRFVVIMKLVPACQPERGSYGFHWFGNAEELLPVLTRPRRSNNNRQAMYFEVGNLNTESYPTSANLPTYVRENYGLDGNHSAYNIDRIIISYQVRTRVLETVYITEHDGAFSGRFSPNRTYEISSELIQALQNPLLDLSTLLTQMDYYRNIQVFQSNAIEDIYYPEPSAQQMLNVGQTYSGSTATTGQTFGLQFYSDAFHQQPNVTTASYNYDQQVHYAASGNPYSSTFVDVYNDLQDSYRRHSYWRRGWVQPYEDLWEGAKKRNEGREGSDFSFVKFLLGVGALYLAIKCFGWLRGCLEESSDENILKRIPWRTPSYKHTHIMLDYVY
ncbi:hypothetical protein Q5P01_026020 [Channa striata]|uniref:Uncharacterized protein n=1 Tax=Channa striata TaxID=64152 RepID=A0AA88LNI4_CHASR|nr:hypothetical protein Q5P01_026020 [Channa striata]